MYKTQLGFRDGTRRKKIYNPPASWPKDASICCLLPKRNDPKIQFPAQPKYGLNNACICFYLSRCIFYGDWSRGPFYHIGHAIDVKASHIFASLQTSYFFLSFSFPFFSFFSFSFFDGSLLLVWSCQQRSVVLRGFNNWLPTALNHFAIVNLAICTSRRFRCTAHRICFMR